MLIFTILAGAVLSLCHGQNSSVFGLTVLELNEILKNFDKAYDKMTDIEKRNFMNKLNESGDMQRDNRRDRSIDVMGRRKIAAKAQ